MALPQQLKSARMTNSTLGIDIDNRVGDIEKALCDIFGFTVDTDITEAPLLFDNSGRIVKALPRLKAAGPVGARFLDSTSAKEFRLCLDGVNIKFDENTGTEAVPVWTNRAYMAVTSGVMVFTGIPQGPASDPTTDNQLTRKFYVDAADSALTTLINGKVSLTGDESVAGVKTFTSFPVTPSSAPTTNYQVANKKYVDDMGAAAGGKVKQVVNVQNGAVSTTTTTFPCDDTIPQNTEGAEFMSVAITPTNASSKLHIQVVVYGSSTTGQPWGAALFKDSDAGALAAICGEVNKYANQVVFNHYITAGSTSAITFKVRAGKNDGPTFTFNGASSARLMGGVAASSITITEIAP
jgi:hypothetical protein